MNDEIRAILKNLAHSCNEALKADKSVRSLNLPETEAEPILARVLDDVESAAGAIMDAIADEQEA